MYEKRHHFLNKSLTPFFACFKFELVERCFNFVKSRLKVLPSFTINSHPDFVNEVKKIKQHLLTANVEIVYEILPYDKRLSKLSSVETFLTTLFVGLFIGFLLGFGSSLIKPINFQPIWFLPLHLVVRLLLFTTWLVLIFSISLLLAYIRFLFREYFLKNTCYLITRNEIYYIDRPWDWLRTDIVPINVKIFDIREVWQPTYEKSDLYDYCGIDAAIVKVYITQTDYVNNFKAIKYEENKDRDSYFTFSHVKLNKFPNDLGREAAPLYIYLATDYNKLTQMLRIWSDNKRSPPKSKKS
jgi:hypothetical protein